jgi:hypothetical protein
MLQFRRAYVVLGLLFALFFLSPERAFAHDLNFDADMNEDGIINLSNPEGIKPGLIADAIDDWNLKVLAAPLVTGPIIVDVTAAGLYSEVRVNDIGGVDANYYARVKWSTQPDQLQFSDRFNNLSAEKRASTTRHELGHTRGHAHTEASFCDVSVMPTLGTCNSAGVPRREDVGSHDVTDEVEMWFGTNATHPVKNKCWTNADANGDGVCDNFGPPSNDTDQEVLHGSPDILNNKPPEPPSPQDMLSEQEPSLP